jgi:hypothetical protein
LCRKALVPIQLQGPPTFSIMPIGKLGWICDYIMLFCKDFWDA